MQCVPRQTTVRVPAVRPKVLMRLSRTKKQVSRDSGGSMCAKCVRDRTKWAFLIEEQKIAESVEGTSMESEGKRNVQLF